MDKKFASRTEVASILGIDRRTFSNYCTGRRHATNVDTRKKLFDLTGIEAFQSDTPDVQDGALLTIWADLYIESYVHRKKDDKRNNKEIDVAKNDDVIIDEPKTSAEGTDVSTNDNKDETVAQKEDLTVVTAGKNSLGGINRPSLDIAADLRNWFNNQHTWKTQKEIADRVGASHTSMKKVFQGVKTPEGIIKQKLYELTQLECFRDDKQEKSVCVEEVNNVPIDDKDVCVDKIGVPLYEVKTSIDKKNGNTKKMNIPIHEVKVQIVEVKKNIIGVEEQKDVVSEIHDVVVEVDKQKDPVSDIQSPVTEVQESL